MGPSVLVAYASRLGSTAEVGRFISRVLQENGLQAEALPISEVRDLGPYQAVILGSAVQEGQWLPEAVTFVRSHQLQLAQKPTALFTVAMNMRESSPEHFRQVYGYLEEVLKLVEPLEIGLFGGALNYRLLSNSQKAVVLGEGLPEGDFRRWQDIRAWADDLAVRLQEEYVRHRSLP